MIQLQLKNIHIPSEYINRLSEVTETPIKVIGDIKQLILSNCWKGAIKAVEIAYGSYAEITSTTALENITTDIEFELEEEWFLLHVYLRNEDAMIAFEAVNFELRKKDTPQKDEQAIVDKVFYTLYETQYFQNNKIAYFINKKWIVENIFQRNQSIDSFWERIRKVKSSTKCVLGSKIYIDTSSLVSGASRLQTSELEMVQLNDLAVFVLNYLLGYENEDYSSGDDIHKVTILANYLKFYDFQKPLPSLESLTKIAGLNRNKLQKIFKEHFGKTYYQFYQEARFLYAEELMRKEGYNISETARKVGFKHISHFSIYFEKVMGYKPIILKKKNY